MSLLEEHCTALAARMVDVELMWLAQRLPVEKEQTAFHRAVKKEAERRFQGMNDNRSLEPASGQRQ